MTDLQPTDLTDPSLNMYYRNRRIRRHLIQAGLINRQGDILPTTSHENLLARRARRQQTRENGSNAVLNYVVNETERRQEFIRKQYDSTTKRVHEKKAREPRKPRRATSRSLNDVHEHVHSNIVRSLSPATQKRSSMRAKSARHASSNINKQSVRRPATAKTINKNQCRVVMIYYGPQTNISYDDSFFQPQGDEISVLQQHCGGENLVVFKGHLKPNETFSFDSRRHRDYPFALAFYINGLIDSRVSVCCEYKHKKQVPLAGKRGLFGIYNVYKVKPCRSCRRHRRKKKLLSSSSITLDPSRYKKSIVPRDSSALRSRSPVISRPSSPPRMESKKQPHSPIISPPSSPSRLPLTTQSHSPPFARTPSLPQVPSKTHSHSPPLVRTPSPPIQDERPSPRETKRIQPKRQIDSNLHADSLSSSEKSDEQHDEKYTSDFDEENKNDQVASNPRFDRPHISDSQSNGNQDESDRSSQSSSSPRRKLGHGSPVVRSEDEDDHNPSKKLLGRNNTNGHSQKSPSSSSRKSNSSSDDDDNDDRPSRVLTGKKKVAGHSRLTSSNTLKKSSPSEDETDRPSSKGLTERTNTTGRPRGSSSSSSKKSTHSPKTEVIKKSSEENDWFTSATAPKNNFEHRQFSSSSKEPSFTPSSVKKSEDTFFSSKSTVHAQQTPTSSSNNGIRNRRPYFEENNEDEHSLSNIWSQGNNKTDTNDGTTRDSTHKARPWKRDNSSDQDNTNSSNKKDSLLDWM